MKKAQQKISFKIYKPLLEIINTQFRSLPLSRDSFLNGLIYSECRYLEKELKGKPALSTRANRYISAKLNGLDKLKEGVKQVNIVVDKETADYLNKVVSEKNIVRDAFLNRLFLFLAAPPNLFNWSCFSGVEKTTEYWPQDELKVLHVSPLQYVSEALRDPFEMLRQSFERVERVDDVVGLYLLQLPEKYTGFTCFMEDKEVPGTEEYEKDQAELAELLNSI